MPPRKTPSKIDRTVALCYVRKSWTRDEKDLISPERQRANIERECLAHGYKAEWFEDTEGHRSGMYEKNRPGWLALKARMGDPDVAAIVANDLSRLHRKGWRIGDLLDFVKEHGINLILADPDRKLDLNTPQGIIFAQLSAIFDEWYAADISQRRKADIAHRKAKGQTVGLPPFGTKRHSKTGFLIPSDEGAWLLPNGTWKAGTIGELPPEDGAVWRGYFDCAYQILTLYAGDKRRGRVLKRLQEDGWAFRDRKGKPSPLELDDIRRVVANWQEYGGHVSRAKAISRHPADQPLEDMIAKLNPDRTVFPIELLAAVAQSRQERAIGRHPAHSVNEKAYTYPLGGIVYCAHCERLAAANNNPRIRSMLSGRLGTYYRHKAGAACGCTKKSLSRDLLEGQFIRLIQALEFRPSSLNLLTQLAARLNEVNTGEQADLETQKREAITLCRARIQAAIDLYGDARISREEYLRRVELNERELQSWQARTTETEQLSLELGMCVDVVNRILRLWQVSDDEDRQGMARHLFNYLVFDLDKGEIVDFRLKPWADQFLQAGIQIKIAASNGDNYDDNPMIPSGFEPEFRP